MASDDVRQRLRGVRSGPTLTDRVLDIMKAAKGHPVKLTELVEALKGEGTAGSVSGTVTVLVQKGRLVRLARGQYQLAEPAQG